MFCCNADEILCNLLHSLSLFFAEEVIDYSLLCETVWKNTHFPPKTAKISHKKPLHGHAQLCFVLRENKQHLSEAKQDDLQRQYPDVDELFKRFHLRSYTRAPTLTLWSLKNHELSHIIVNQPGLEVWKNWNHVWKHEQSLSDSAKQKTNKRQTIVACSHKSFHTLLFKCLPSIMCILQSVFVGFSLKIIK